MSLYSSFFIPFHFYSNINLSNIFIIGSSAQTTSTRCLHFHLNFLGMWSQETKKKKNLSYNASMFKPIPLDKVCMGESHENSQEICLGLPKNHIIIIIITHCNLENKSRQVFTD